MNRYASMAWRHWERHRPDALSRIPDPEAFFRDLGETVEEEITRLSLDLAGDDPPGETYLQKMGRLNMAQLQAREKVLNERVFLPPEQESQQGGEAS